MADREALGRLVREAWAAWAREQPAPKPSWLVPWEEISEAEREVDRRIGEALARAGADAEREECAAICERDRAYWLETGARQALTDAAGEIRERGQS